uniref:Amino acid transporter transmembrane domain-containing protein n=1 Tax=Nelumbo nucifera TaxID=4432 RepID=A0A822Y3V4_NELNU|nr:TPA_asm: hypothetical protein HUJ06_028151 [Nelumbo nucifera]
MLLLVCSSFLYISKTHKYNPSTLFLQVQYRDRLASEEVHTYGDLGLKAFGMTGQYLTEFLICISQCGGSVAYLVFIGQNLSSIVGTHTFDIVFLHIPLVAVEFALSWIRSLSALSPFTIFVDICNVLVMVIVVNEDLQLFDGFSKRGDYKRWRVAPLEALMRKSKNFRWVLGQAFTGITLVYGVHWNFRWVLFGFSGHLAYGDQTRDIITLNLSEN